MRGQAKSVVKGVLKITGDIGNASPNRLLTGAIALMCTLTSITCGGNTFHSNSGQPCGGPLVCLNPSQMNFGTVAVGSTSTSQTATVSNCGCAALHITSINDPPGFRGENNCPVGGSLDVNATCHIQETFAPQSAGTDINVCVSIDSDSPLSPSCLTVSGTGQ